MYKYLILSGDTEVPATDCFKNVTELVSGDKILMDNGMYCGISSILESGIVQTIPYVTNTNRLFKVFEKHKFITKDSQTKVESPIDLNDLYVSESATVKSFIPKLTEGLKHDKQLDDIIKYSIGDTNEMVYINGEISKQFIQAYLEKISTPVVGKNNWREIQTQSSRYFDILTYLMDMVGYTVNIEVGRKMGNKVSLTNIYKIEFDKTIRGEKPIKRIGSLDAEKLSSDPDEGFASYLIKIDVPDDNLNAVISKSFIRITTLSEKDIKPQLRIFYSEISDKYNKIDDDTFNPYYNGNNDEYCNEDYYEEEYDNSYDNWYNSCNCGNECNNTCNGCCKTNKDNLSYKQDSRDYDNDDFFWCDHPINNKDLDTPNDKKEDDKDIEIELTKDNENNINIHIKLNNKDKFESIINSIFKIN